MLSRAFIWSKLNVVSRQFNWNANSSTTKYTFLSQVTLESNDAVPATSTQNKTQDQELAKNNEGNAINENFDSNTNKKAYPNEQKKNSQNKNYQNKKREGETSYKNSKSQREKFSVSSSNQPQMQNKKYMDNRENYFKNKKSEKITRVDFAKKSGVSTEREVNLDQIKTVSLKDKSFQFFQIRLKYSNLF